MRTAVGAAVVLVFPVVWMLGLRALQRRGRLSPELARKLFHIGGGLLGLALPWLTPEPWVVILLTALSIGGLFALTRSRRLDQQAGKVLTSVDRDSLGDLCFPVSVCILFLVARWNLVLYGVPILILTFGDAVAALIGVRYGLKRYASTDGFKSVEGSTAFFITAFFCAHVPLLLGTDIGRAECLLIAAIMGLLVMMLEAVAWNGLDNLFIPLASYILLRAFLHDSLRELIAQLGVTAALAALILLVRKRVSLNPSGLFGAIFAGYVFWFGGDYAWFTMPLLVLLAYQRLSPHSEGDRYAVHDIHVVLCVCSAGLAYLFCAETFARPELLLAATISFAAHLAIIGGVRWHLKTGAAPSLAASAATILTAWLLLSGAYVAIGTLRIGWRMDWLTDAAIALLGVVLAVAVYRAIAPPVALGEVDLSRWRWQAVAAAVGSLAGLAPLGGAAIQKLW
jgi:phytol kinase